MSTFGLYFRSMQQDDANALRARLNALAAELGYTATGGPTMGEGNLAELLRAIDRGEVTLSKKEKRTMEHKYTVKTWKHEDPDLGPGAFQGVLLADNDAQMFLEDEDETTENWRLTTSRDMSAIMDQEPLIISYAELED